MTRRKAGVADMTACGRLKTRYESMKAVLKSLQTIAGKCQELAEESGIDFTSDNQLVVYEDLLKQLTDRLVPSDQQTSNGFDDSDGENNGQQLATNDMNRSLEDLSTEIVVFQKYDKTYRKHLKYYRCPVDDCGLESHSRGNIITHLVRHTNDLNFRCRWPNCDKKFGYEKSMVAHIESYHLRKDRFKCCVDSCGQTFGQNCELKLHVTQHHPLSRNADHQCVWIECHLEYKALLSCRWPYCGQKFIDQKLLDTHMEDNHLKSRVKHQEMDANCDKDNNLAGDGDGKGSQKSSTTKYRPLNRRNTPNPADQSGEIYINQYTGKPLARPRRAKKYQCSWPACEMAFESGSAIRKHMRKHTGEKPYACDWKDCGKTFRYNGGLKLHKEMAHLKLKQFQCSWPECGEAFIANSQLKVHESVHTGVKRLQCQWPGCEWRTNHPQQLRKHVKQDHQGIKVYTKRYSTKSDPNSNYDFKGQLKKYPCSFPGCDRRFRFQSNVKHHLKSHINTDSGEVKVPIQRRPRRPKGTAVLPLVSKKYPCDWPGCTANPMPTNMLIQHMDRHRGITPFKCRHCDHSFSYRSTLRSHILHSHPKDEALFKRQFICKLGDCTRSFDSQKALRLHVKRIHENDTASNCNDLNSNYDNSDSFSVNYNDTKELQTPSPQQLPVHQPQQQPSQVISFDRIQAFNTLLYQPSIDNQWIIPSVIVPPVATTSRPTTHTTAQKLLNNALRSQRTGRTGHRVSSSDGGGGVPVDAEFIANELPIACTQEGCYRRFKTQKALQCHIKKFHPSN